MNAPTPEEWREQDCCGCTFKDFSCGYRGSETWCDHTVDRCAKLGNLKRYDGAQPDILEPMQVQFLDVVTVVFCLLCYWYAWRWQWAMAIYTLSCGYFIPQVRHEVILWWILHVQPLRRHLVRRDTSQDID